MTTLHAQPYGICANGFYFESEDEYQEKVKQTVRDFGQLVEEFEIQFIEGERIDRELAAAIDLNQANFAAYLELCEVLDEQDKCILIVAVGRCGYNFDPLLTTSGGFDVDLYEMSSLLELAEYFVDEGVIGDIPERLLNYFDYAALARDLTCDYAEVTIAGKRYIYGCR